MNKIICYINSNYIQIKKENEIIKINSKGIINGEIINSKIFKEDIKKTKLFNGFFSNKVEILLNKDIEEKDKLYYEIIFEDLNCTNINVISTKNKLENNTLILCYPIYILYLKNKYIKIDEELLDYYIKIHKIKQLKVISEKKLKNNKNYKYYYYNNSDNYFLN